MQGIFLTKRFLKLLKIKMLCRLAQGKKGKHKKTDAQEGKVTPEISSTKETLLCVNIKYH